MDCEDDKRIISIGTIEIEVDGCMSRVSGGVEIHEQLSEDPWNVSINRK